MNQYTKDRFEMYKELEKEFGCPVIAFATSDRPSVEMSIEPNQVDYFVEHLDKIGSAKKICLLIYTCGGNTLAARNIINLFYEYCKELVVIIPNKCRSAGTLMSLGANLLVMTKQATLGPIDPSMASPLGPQININGALKTIPVSVESVNGYFELLKNVAGAKNNKSKCEAFIKLSNNVNPLLLGDVYRAKKQIKMLASELIKHHQDIGYFKQQKVIKFLCSDSGSHDYTISRTEARNLGLKVVSPTEKQYLILKKWYDNLSDDFELKKQFDPRDIIKNHGGSYNLKRAFIESVQYGSNAYFTQGLFNQIGTQTMQQQIQDNRIFDGWKKDV